VHDDDIPPWHHFARIINPDPDGHIKCNHLMELALTHNRLRSAVISISPIATTILR